MGNNGVLTSWQGGFMSSPTVWSAGRYEAVAERIAPIASEVIAAVDRRAPVRDTSLVDLACGTGSAAFAAAAAGARVTAVDITPELVALGAHKAQAAGLPITWRTADAADTGLSAGAFDAAVSNMGIIFVEPTALVAEVARLLKPGGIFGFSSWVPDPGNPFFAPIVAVLGPPPDSGYAPDQWGDPDTINARLAAFEGVDIENGWHTWRFGSVDAAVEFVAHESPMHVSMLGSLDAGRRDRLLAAFEEAMAAHAASNGEVAFDAPYLVASARRR